MRLSSKTIIFASLCFLFASTDCQVSLSASNAKCTYLNTQIYCYKDFYYQDGSTGQGRSYLISLDIENNQKSQTIQSLSSNWQNVANNGDPNRVIPQPRYFSSVMASTDQSTMYLMGGLNYGTRIFVNQNAFYSVQNNTWYSIPNYTDPTINNQNRQIFYSAMTMIPASGQNGDRLVFFGGIEKDHPGITPVNLTGVVNTTFTDTLPLIKNTDFNCNLVYRGYDGIITYDILNGEWGKFPNQQNYPADFYFPFAQTATYYQPEGKILFLAGGQFPAGDGTKAYIPNALNYAWSFSTNNGTWFLESFTGDVPSSRNDHTATIMPNEPDVLLLYGGTKYLSSGASTDFLYTLNMRTNVWTSQSSLNVPSNINAPRFQHSAVLVNTTLFILYGRDVQGNLANGVLALDVSNSTNMSFLTAYPAGHVPSSGLSGGAIAGIVVAAVAVVAAIVLFVLCMRRRRNKAAEYKRQEESTLRADWDRIERYDEVPAGMVTGHSGIGSASAQHSKDSGKPNVHHGTAVIPDGAEADGSTVPLTSSTEGDTVHTPSLVYNNKTLKAEKPNQ